MMKRMKMKSIFLTEFLNCDNIVFYVRIGKPLNESHNYIVPEAKVNVTNILTEYGYVSVLIPGMMNSGYVCVHGKGKFKTFQRIILNIANNHKYNFIEVKLRIYAGISESDVSQDEAESSHDEIVRAVSKMPNII